MGAEQEATDQRSIPQLPIFSLPAAKLRPAGQPGIAPSPLHTAASVPFRWEEHPGKPRPCSITTTTTTTKCLELPPRLQQYNEHKHNKIPSPTTVLEGPYYSQLGRSIFQSSSFRFNKGINHRRDVSLDGGSRASSPDRGLLGDSMALSSRRVGKDRGRFGSLRRRGFSFGSWREILGGGIALSDKEGGGGDGARWTELRVESMRIKRSRLDLSEPKSSFWVTIYGVFKQVIPRRSNKWKKYDT
ncbi:hypothetical protein AKJ16_DCAP17197 [Drosera capensis]